MSKWNAGDKAYIIENNINTREVKIVKVAAGFATVRFVTGSGGTRVRESRLFSTKEEAEASLSVYEDKKPVGGHWN